MIPRLARQCLFALALLPGLAPVASRAQLPATVPKGAIILTVTGLDPDRQPRGTVRFDRGALAALGPVTFATTSIWTEGRHYFTGIPIAKLAAALGLRGDESLILHALNDYQVDFPLAEAGADAPILAYEMDGKPMSVRDKGPIWLVYPYDDDPEAYQSVTAFARSVWQLDRIDVAD